MSDGTELVKKEVADYVNGKIAELEARAEAYADAPKPRWYVLAGFLGGALVGVVATLAVMAAR